MNSKRIIDSSNYTGQDRRNGNGRMKLSMRDWYLILVVIVGATLWLGKLQWTATAQEEKIKLTEKTPQDIALIKKDITYIQKDVGEIKKDIKLILDKI